MGMDSHKKKLVSLLYTSYAQHNQLEAPSQALRQSGEMHSFYLWNSGLFPSSQGDPGGTGVVVGVSL